MPANREKDMQANEQNRPAGREITDMAGRRATLPAVVKTVYSASPYGFTALCSIAPEMLPGLIQPLPGESLKYLPACLHKLPVIGMLPDTDGLAKARPDLVVVWAETKKPFHKKSEDALNALNLPFVYVIMGDLVDLADYPAAYDFLGLVLNQKERTDRLASYCRQTLSEVEAVLQRVPADKRPRVYYAEGRDGLATEFDDSLHAHLLKLAGDVNIHRGNIKTHAGMERVSIEQIAAAGPDIIIALERAFFADVFKNPDWKQVKAVIDRRVFLIPSLPFNWFDRPPSFMRFIGLKWLMKCLYPEHYHIDLIAEIRHFFSLFLGVTISAAEAAELINQPVRHQTKGLTPHRYPDSLKPTGKAV